MKIPVFFVEFSDAPLDPSKTVADVQLKMFRDGNSGDYPYESLKNYYQRSSYTQLTITGEVYGWYPAAHPRSYYLSMGAPQGRVALINEILQAYDRQVNFADYDADHNGKMDAPPVIARLRVTLFNNNNLHLFYGQDRCFAE